MIAEHERIVLLTDLPEQGLEGGDVGVVVHVHGAGEAYMVEFMTLDGETIDVVTLEASQVRAVGEREIAHARKLPAA
jgi:hypothetical protein